MTNKKKIIKFQTYPDLDYNKKKKKNKIIKFQVYSDLDYSILPNVYT